MTPTLATLLFAAVSFILTFAVARALRKWYLKRQEEKKQAQAEKDQSRQVRRARGRKKKTAGRN
jgi:membrane protein implicated in regulation of membrane protease activity